MGFSRILNHTGEVAIQVHGPALDEVFAQTARGVLKAYIDKA